MLHAVTVAQATDVNESIKILRLDFRDAAKGAHFHPGQRLILHLDGSEVLRGFAIISAPIVALAAQGVATGSQPHVDIIIQNAPTIQTRPRANVSLSVGTQLNISFGESFLSILDSVGTTPITRIVFIAGGVGVSPLISLLSHILGKNTLPQEIHFLYACSVKGYYDISHVLGLERLLNISNVHARRFYLYLFFSSHASRTLMEAAVPRQRFEPRVMMGTDVLDLFRKVEPKHTTVCYVAGPPKMTSYFVKLLQQEVGMDSSRVLYEEYESEVSQVHTEI